MKTRFLLVSGFMVLSLVAGACGGKPAAPAASPAASPSAKPAGGDKTAANKTTNKAKPGDKKPEAPKKENPKKLPIPADWDLYYDEAKGYEFYVPAGTVTDWQTVEGVDIFVAQTTTPSDIGAFVIAFKDKERSKEDLLTDAKKFLAGLGEKDVTFGKVEELNEDYSLADFTSTDEKGVKTKGKVLVATDVTDNYIVLVGSPEAKYGEYEQIINEIWGSFSMYSGGFSGNS